MSVRSNKSPEAARSVHTAQLPHRSHIRQVVPEMWGRAGWLFKEDPWDRQGKVSSQGTDSGSQYNRRQVQQIRQIHRSAAQSAGNYCLKQLCGETRMNNSQ
jgi:hypothetical protein